MLKIMFFIILSPLVIFCGILSITIIYVVLGKVIDIFARAIKTIIDRDDDKC